MGGNYSVVPMTQNQNTASIDWVAELSANGGWLSRVVFARLGDRHAVEDVLQELGMSIAKWPSTLQGSNAIQRWLYSVAVRQALMHRRSRDRRTKRVERYASIASRPNGSERPLDRMIASENSDWVHHGLKQLTARQREVLLLKYFEGWSCRQIAEKCGLKESTVQRHLVNARHKLRSHLLRKQVER